MKFIYCFDFDGVLVDSAAELGISGYEAAKLLCPGAPWLSRKLRRPDQLQALIDNFCRVRPCLETGWEAPLLIKLLLSPQQQDNNNNNHPDIDYILRNFHPTLLQQTLKELDVTVDQCKEALETARNAWIASDEDNGQDWLEAHQFYEGACQSVRALIAPPNDHSKVQDVYVITTKAADFTIRLLEQQGLAGKEGGIPPDHIFGLGSPPKEKVLANLLHEKGEDYGAVFVEDRLLTLDKTMQDSTVNTRVLPVVASWGYNTEEQREQGKQAGYVVLDAKDSSTLASVLQDDAAEKLLKELNRLKKQKV